MIRSKAWLLFAATAACAATPSSSISAAPTEGKRPPLDERASHIAEDEIHDLGARASTREAHVVIVDPRDGAILAIAGGERRRERFVAVPDLPLRAGHVPGSVMKPFTIAAALEEKTLAPDQTFSGEGGAWKQPTGEILRDASAHGDMSLGDVLAFSSNIATAKIGATLGKERLASAFTRFGFGASTSPEFPAARPGSFPFATATPIEVLLLAGGEGGRATPFEVAVAFATIANGGVRHPPSIAHHPDAPGERVLSPSTVRVLMPLLEGVVARDDGTGTKARVGGTRVAGKTGTAEEGAVRYGTFVGALPAEAPRVVILVAVATTDSTSSGGTIAAPAFRHIAGRLMSAGLL